MEFSKNPGHKKSIYKGVSWSKGNEKWKAQIRIKGKVTHICYCSNEKEAAIRYKEAAIRRNKLHLN